MAPKRAARGGAVTPSPAPRPSPGPNATPGRVISGRITETSKAAGVRTPMPTKYSTSYGSPMSQLPNRAVIHGGGSLQEAASEILKTVKEDHRAAVEARRKAEERRNIGSERGSVPTAPTSTRASTRHESVEVEEEEPREESPEVEEEDVEPEPKPTTRRAGRPAKKTEPPKRATKRAREDAEAEKQQAEKERAEREERLRRERSAEAHRKAEEHLAKLKAAADKERAEQEQREAEENARLAREEAARQKAEERRAREAAKKAEQERRAQEEAARLKAQQEKLAQEEAAKRAAEAEALKQRFEEQRRQLEASKLPVEDDQRKVAQLGNTKRQASMPPPRAPRVLSAGRGSSVPPVSTPISTTVPRIPESVRSFVEESDVFGNAQLQTPKPPTQGRKPVTARPSKSIPEPESDSDSSSSPSSSSDPLTSENDFLPPAAIKKPTVGPTTGGKTAGGKTTGDKTTGGKTTGGKTAGSSSAPRPPAPVEQPAPPRPIQENLRPRNPAQPRPSTVETLKSSLTSWSLWKIFLTSLLILYGYRLIYSLARPDLFESPVMSIRWYGWRNWKANAGQFFPSPLLHPLGVLTENQYDDLKVFLHEESSSTAEAVKSLQDILPRMVHVKQDKRKNKLIIDDEFWRALKDQIRSDDSILTLLEDKSDISDKHWKVFQNRLQKSGDVESIADRTITKSWENWLKENQKRVADIVAKNLPKGGKAGNIQDAVIPREEFTAKLKPILEQNKLTSAKLKELEKLINKSRSSSSGEVGISEAKVKEIVNKAIQSARLEAAAHSEISKFNAELHRQVNHFGIGNGAAINEQLTSPTWEVTIPPLGTKEWLKLPTIPRFLAQKSAALSAWDEAGHCWCAGTQINATHSRPADLFVHLGNVVIPQHVVLEHINPSATLDPDSMPKDIEVWAQFDEYHREGKILDFMEVQFPGSRRNNPELLSKGFLQIGKFRYEHKLADKGVKVERLSKELVGLNAATDHVLIRATSNHGAPDHTCFYRIRLYGEVVELGPGEKESKKWS